ncbi:MAG: enoyl-CoA hydratase/isomerase family protein [Beijerinckiaceae bacterium]|nr:enoyl-CoA hydratase/isomerase family protein [Beijerinckiaceae bacterium]
MTSFEFETIRSGGIFRIDLGRPEDGNKLTRSMMRDLAETIRRGSLEAETRVIVLQGRGDFFCAGRDGRGESTAGLKPHEVREQMMGAVLSVYAAINASPVPVVALVQKPAVGFGAALAGGCDITLVAEGATLAFSEIKHGIPPTLAMAAVMKKVPAKALAWLIYSGADVTAQEALVMGLASKVLAGASFDAETDAFLIELASRPRIVLETIKKFMLTAQDMSAAQQSEYAGTLLALVRS